MTYREFILQYLFDRLQDERWEMADAFIFSTSDAEPDDEEYDEETNRFILALEDVERLLKGQMENTSENAS